MTVDNPTALLFASITLWVCGFLLGILILWWIIRGAVLSALRKHADEQADLGRRTTL